MRVVFSFVTACNADMQLTASLSASLQVDLLIGTMDVEIGPWEKTWLNLVDLDAIGLGDAMDH